MPKKPIRQIRVEGNIAYVPLKRGYEATIDVADVHLVDAWNWYALVKLRTVYAVRWAYSGPNRRAVWMHRVIMGDPVGLQIDHIDGEGLNNQRANLRAATGQQNMHNRRVNRNSVSGIKGVRFVESRGKWQARIRLDGKSRCLGHHETSEAAYAAYCEASERLHGEFGRAR